MTGAPIAEARRSGSLYVVEACPICGGRHVHGGTGHKSPHCTAIACRDCGESHIGGVPRGALRTIACTPSRKKRVEGMLAEYGGYVVREVKS